MIQVYLDTCIVSGLADPDLKEEQRAAERVAALANSSRVSLVASSVAREELEKIPVEYREPHLAQYSLLGQLSSAQTTWLQPMSREAATDPVYQALVAALPDRVDAEHIFQAHSSNVTTFLTTDKKTILRHREHIRSICNVNVMLPSEFLASSSLTSACS